MISKSSQTYEELRQNASALIGGIVLCIDPSIGSMSSMPGFAVYVKGTLTESGTLEIDPSGSIWSRLQQLSHGMRKLIRSFDPDVLVYEKVPVSAHSGRSQVSHASLLYSVGAILSISGPVGYVGLMPVSWKPLVRPEYVKGDREDAVEIGWIAIEEAKRIRDTNPKRKYGQRKGKDQKEEAGA